MRCFNLFLLTFLHFSAANLCAQIADTEELETTVIADTPDGIQILSTPGIYSYKARSDESRVAGLYLLAAAEDQIKLTFTEFDVPCGGDGKTGSLVQYTDGWELNGQEFPITDAKADPVNTEFCSNNQPGERAFVSSQNGALITYRISEVGKGFTLRVEHRKHPSPCNVIFNDEPYVVLRNHGKKANCSYWFLDKLIVKLNSYSVPRYTVQCSESSDRIEVGRTDGLDASSIDVLAYACDEHQSDPLVIDTSESTIGSSGTIVKLLSSGAHENYLNVTFQRVDF